MLLLLAIICLHTHISMENACVSSSCAMCVCFSDIMSWMCVCCHRKCMCRLHIGVSELSFTGARHIYAGEIRIFPFWLLLLLPISRFSSICLLTIIANEFSTAFCFLRWHNITPHKICSYLRMYRIDKNRAQSRNGNLCIFLTLLPIKRSYQLSWTLCGRTIFLAISSERLAFFIFSTTNEM